MKIVPRKFPVCVKVAMRKSPSCVKIATPKDASCVKAPRLKSAFCVKVGRRMTPLREGHTAEACVLREGRAFKPADRLEMPSHEVKFGNEKPSK